MFLELDLFVKSSATFTALKPVLASVFRQMILVILLCCKYLITELTLIFDPLMFLHVSVVVIKIGKSLLTIIAIETELPSMTLHMNR